MVMIMDATDWGMAIEDDLRQSAWERSRPQPTLWSQWNTYVNLCCHDQLLQWLQNQDFPQARSAQSLTQHFAYWHQGTGFAIELDHVRLIGIPSESIDHSELLVPADWVDRSDNLGDYYIAVHLSADGSALQLVGYTTHQHLKQTGEFDPIDRTYSIPQEDLTTDFNLLWLTYPRYSAEQTRAIVASNVLANVQSTVQSTVQSNIQSSVERLDQSITRLGNWLQGQVDDLWQSLEEGLSGNLVPSLVPIPVRGAIADTVANTADETSQVRRVKLLSFPSGNLGLVVEIGNVNPISNMTDLQIKIMAIPDSTAITDEIQLRLLTIDRTELDQITAASTEMIQLEFEAEYGEAFIVEVSCEGEVRSESFMI
jgi:Protein of unknown function (DUF1822)